MFCHSVETGVDSMAHGQATDQLVAADYTNPRCTCREMHEEARGTMPFPAVRHSNLSKPDVAPCSRSCHALAIRMGSLYCAKMAVAVSPMCSAAMFQTGHEATVSPVRGCPPFEPTKSYGDTGCASQILSTDALNDSLRPGHCSADAMGKSGCAKGGAGHVERRWLCEV
jgi:hypothetical protein